MNALAGREYADRTTNIKIRHFGIGLACGSVVKVGWVGVGAVGLSLGPGWSGLWTREPAFHFHTFCRILEVSDVFREYS
jgi:hypothetical protein